MKIKNNSKRKNRTRSNHTFKPLSSMEIEKQVNLSQGYETYMKLGFDFKLIDGFRVPEYPQVLFTLTGDWKGWNHLLSTDPNSEHYSENILQDKKDFVLFGNIWLMMLETDIDIPDIHFKRICDKVVNGII